MLSTVSPIQFGMYIRELRRKNGDLSELTVKLETDKEKTTLSRFAESGSQSQLTLMTEASIVTALDKITSAEDFRILKKNLIDQLGGISDNDRHTLILKLTASALNKNLNIFA